MYKTVQLAFFEKAKQLPHRQVAVAAYRHENHILSILYFALGVSIAAYLYFVGLSIMNLIANREASAESERLRNAVAALEQDYFELSKGVTADAAAAHGLSKPSNTSFIRAQVGVASNQVQDDL